MDFLDHDIASISAFLSSERLATFQKITGSTTEAILLHQQMLQFGTTLMSVTAVVEIAVRNAICERITSLLGGGGWLRTPPAPFVWEPSEKSKIGLAEASARKAAYAKIPHGTKKLLDPAAFPNGITVGHTHEAISKARQKTITVADGQVIAQLTMAFWKRLFSTEYEHTLWNRSLKHIFPDKQLKRSHVAVQFEEIYQARNRIAHHEPIYDKRLERVLKAIEFVIEKFGTADATGKTPLAKLLEDDLNVLLAEAIALEEKIDTFRTAGNGVDKSDQR
jgi:hypothetical protein